MKVKLIAALAANGIIGKNNALPWHLPEDLAFFKATTMGCPVIMGRKTYESINRPLPGRLNVVLTTQPDWKPAPNKDGQERLYTTYPEQISKQSSTQIALAHDLDDALRWLQIQETIFLIGGGNLYEQALRSNVVDELILTEIHASFEGDASFPVWDKTRFQEINRTRHLATAERAWGFDFVNYQKI